MPENKLTKEIMKKALECLDNLLPKSIELIMGGGGAMILAHQYPLSTTDIDAIPRGMEAFELDPYVKEVAKTQNLSIDWLNPYFSTFSHTLPNDFMLRTVRVFQGKKLTVLALGKEEMLIMKCFAHRQKDIGHAKQLIKNGADVDMVFDCINAHIKNKTRGAQEALDFIEELLDD